MYVGLRPAILLPASELSKIKGQCNTGRFIMFSVITNIYNKKTKRPTLIELFTATGIFFFWQLEMFDVCTTGDAAHSSCYTRVTVVTRV